MIDQSHQQVHAGPTAAPSVPHRIATWRTTIGPVLRRKPIGITATVVIAGRRLVDSPRSPHHL